MATESFCYCVFGLCCLGAWARVFIEYHGFDKGILIPVGSMLVVSMLTLAGTLYIRNEIIRYCLTLKFTLLQVFIHFFVETNEVWVEAFSIFSVGAIFGIRGFGCWMQDEENKRATGEEGAAGGNVAAVQQIEDRIRESMKFIIFNYIAAFCITLISMILNIKCIKIKKNHEANTDESQYDIPILLGMAVPSVIGHIPLYWERVFQFMDWCNTQRQVFQGWCNHRWEVFQGWCNNRWEVFQGWCNNRWQVFQEWRNMQMQRLGNWWNIQIHNAQNCCAGIGNWWNVQWGKMTGVGRSSGNDERAQEGVGGAVELQQAATHAAGVVELEQVVTDN